ncbi:MAG TPA: hypothetical protein VF147_16500 [Vicinamibacterales bacterium]
MRTAAAALVFVLVSLACPSAGEIPGARIPIVQERRYVMSGAVRPLLFWIKRDDIGLARIVWRRGPDGSRGYELLVGTEPTRAPGGINRWGFISEAALGSDGALLALMTGSQQTSFDNEAAAAAKRGGEFQAAITRVQGGIAEWRLARIRTADTMTVHDVSTVVGSVPRSGSMQQRTVTSTTRPGFLMAVADMLDIAHQTAGQPLPKDRIRYVFGDQVYEMHLRDVERVSVRYNGTETPVLKTSFETRTLATGAKTQFVIATGTCGDLAGVPIEIEWQPRWWLRVRLQLAAGE